MTQATQPKVEWGFYAITPRIVRTQYKNLSHAEKWLYVCLKDLCGEKGMCYRTLRSLSEETNISIASLSSMIPNLQKAGLIHAEKKKRSNSGKEIWHISIVDIWQANHEYCSKIEQSEQVVQNLNNDVQNLNEVSQDCSENERVCSDFPYRRITPEEETITEERTIEEREVATATARSQSSSQNDLSEDDETVKREAVKPSQKDVAQNGHAHQHPVVDHHSPVGIHQPESAQPEHRKDTNKVGHPPAPSKAHVNKSPFPVPKRTKPPSNIMDTLPSEEAVRIMNDWDSIFSRPCTRTENHIKAAELLVPCHPTKDDLSDIRKFCYSSNPKWYRDKGVSLQDVAKNFDKWQSHQEAPKPDKEPSNEHKASSFYTLDAFIERQNQWKTEGVTS